LPALDDRNAIWKDKDVVLGVRPEELKIASPGQASLNGIIDVVEPTGPDTMIAIDLVGQPLTARVPPRFRSKRGDSIGLSVDPASVNLFDPATEQRLW
jgi:multiple sugar transport system ATP-binding protein